MVNTEIRLIILAAKDGEALYSQQKQDQELTVAQIMYLTLAPLIPRPCQAGVDNPGIHEEGHYRYIVGFHQCLCQSIQKKKGGTFLVVL